MLGLNMAAFQSAQVWQVRGEPQGMYNGLKYTKVYFITEINQIKAWKVFESFPWVMMLKRDVSLEN